MPQLIQAIGRLKLLLAEIESRSQHVEVTARQFRMQMQHVTKQAMYGRASLDTALTVTAEIDDRLADAVAVQRRLEVIRSCARQELEALLILQQVEDARKLLDMLRQRVQEIGGPDEQTQAEIKRIEEFIAENSQRAGRTIAEGR
jgi:hypothetical protein